MRSFRFSIILLLSLVWSAAAGQSARPKLVVNIVVSQMRYDYLLHFGHNFSDTGAFKRFGNEGIVFADARYDFMQTITPATLATLTTGTEPSMHGVVSDRWIDYTTNTTVRLIEDFDARGLDCDAGLGRYSGRNLTVPTLGDRLMEQVPGSRVVTIAPDPLSAIVLGGQTSEVYWMDDTRGTWISSTKYMSALPSWVTEYNRQRHAMQYVDYEWMPLMPASSYANKRSTVFDGKGKRTAFDFLRSDGVSRDYRGILYTPAGNTLVTEFVKQAIQNERLGQGEYTDMLNICYDSPRYVGEVFGGESMEVEDMFYRLDREIGELIDFIGGKVDMNDVLVVLTSDHGASDSYDSGEAPRERFNVSQFRVVVNSFMIAQYGPGQWVTDYFDRQLYLDRNLIYTKGLSLEEVQNRIAAFVLQFRGVAHVLTSTVMSSSYFSGSYAEKMQNSFYPKRSGDLTINLMPGWIEEVENRKSLSGSMYEYDTHVPLMMLGSHLPRQHVLRTVNMRDVAPTMARIMQISRPVASEGELIEEAVELSE